MSRRRSDDEDLAYGERWDHNRLAFERDRFEERDRYFTRAPPRERVREASVDERFVERRAPRPWEEDSVRERKYHDGALQRRRSPPPDLERSIYLEKERDREYRKPSPPRRPAGLLRRQSSLDTFDRRPAQRMYDRDRESERDRDEYAPPSHRREYRPDPYEPIPLPRSRALPPPRMYAEHDFEEIKVTEPSRFGDDDFHGYPEHVMEREIVRTKKHRDRSASRTSRTTSRRSRSRRASSRSSSTSSSETGGTAITAKSEYPKKGKTRVPLRLINIRAVVELQYPYVIEENTVIIQKALGQKNIDDLLRLSEEYKKADAELAATRSIPGTLVEERREEVFTIPPPAPPTLIRAPPPPPPVEFVKETMVREISPSRSHYTTTSHGTSRTPVVIDAGPREVSDNVLVGPLALVGDRRLEHHHHHAHHSHSHSHSRERDVVRAERLPTGELVLYEEEIERIEEPRRGVRIEKDKKGPPPKLMRAMLATLT
ncbi:hypothetical protein FHL15_010094 [Xylaria flabelliformis]|uniref:DUF8035 domain-containing protein n=1 Tax=Xylaria flabelliformis TaxID=2512241 RepID=A0A553HLZ3_9PEZI|nr:hypothetical protein FHL15_010094 [Xylaria flabelliformis]